MEVQLSRTEALARSVLQKYNHQKYWNYRAKVIDPAYKSKLGNYRMLWYIKRADAFNNASTGTHINFGAKFASPPNLPHGLNGIIISHNAVIGKNCTIFHQVTIGEGRGGAPTIGDNVLIGAGSKVIGGIHIGNNAKIAAGLSVMQDIPDNAVVLPGELKIKIKNGD